MVSTQVQKTDLALLVTGSRRVGVTLAPEAEVTTTVTSDVLLLPARGTKRLNNIDMHRRNMQFRAYAENPTTREHAGLGHRTKLSQSSTNASSIMRLYRSAQERYQ